MQEFNKVALIGSVLGGICLALPYAFDTLGSVPLEPDETSLVTGIFGDGISSAPLRKVFGKCIARRTMEMQVQWKSGTTFHVCDSEYWSANYAKESVPGRFGGFVHEVTHLWQNQQGDKAYSGRCRSYAYTLTADAKFQEYCSEQQGAIMEDYSQRFLHPSHRSTYYVRSTPENDAMLAALVEKQFPGARALRMSLENRERAQVAAAAP